MLIGSVPYNIKDAHLRVTEHVLQVLPDYEYPLAIICIGTDRVTGDAFGPLVGTFLTGYGIDCFGTLEKPVHAGNLERCLQTIRAESFILAVDACLGTVNCVGRINCYRGAISPGSGVGKELKPVGNAGLTMTVNVHGLLGNVALANTRLSLVYAGAQVAALGIYRAIKLNKFAQRQETPAGLQVIGR